jgi:GMP synthase (glutamine-hydrolysing)
MIYIIDCGSKKTPDISKYVSIFYPFHKVISKEEITEEKVSDAKAIIISGAPILLSKMDVEPVKKKFQFIAELNIPILGICFGHQVLALVNGANVFLGPEVRKPVEIEILTTSELFSGFENQVLFVQDHTEGIDLPDNFSLLAKSKDYTVEAMKHKSKPHYGVQFHPEVSGENGIKLFKNFISLIQ